jgi:hypothetical protein
MNTRSLSQKISQRMKMDFEAPAVIQHAGSKGTVRELTSDHSSRAVSRPWLRRLRCFTV